MFVIEKSRNPIITAIGQALQVSNFPSVLWESNIYDINTMIESKSPEVLIITRDFLTKNGHELENYFNKLKIVCIGQKIDLPISFYDKKYCINNIINKDIKLNESYATEYSIFNDSNNSLILQNTIKTLIKYGVSNYRIYGPRTINNYHFVGNILQTSYGYIYKNSKYIIDLGSGHYGNAELHNNKSIWYHDLEDHFLGESNFDPVDLNQNCFAAIDEILKMLDFDYTEHINNIKAMYNV